MTKIGPPTWPFLVEKARRETERRDAAERKKRREGEKKYKHDVEAGVDRRQPRSHRAIRRQDRFGIGQRPGFRDALRDLPAESFDLLFPPRDPAPGALLALTVLEDRLGAAAAVGGGQRARAPARAPEQGAEQEPAEDEERAPTPGQGHAACASQVVVPAAAGSGPQLGKGGCGAAPPLKR